MLALIGPSVVHSRPTERAEFFGNMNGWLQLKRIWYFSIEPFMAEKIQRMELEQVIFNIYKNEQTILQTSRHQSQLMLKA